MLRAHKGFTLIELLIVIAIILILIAIALPNFLEAQIRARVVNAKGNLRAIQTALEAYATDYQYDFVHPNPSRSEDRYGPYPPQRVRRPQQPDMECWNNYQVGCLNILSTPVPYLKDSSAVTDPFQNQFETRGGASDEVFLRPFGYWTPGRKGMRSRFSGWHNLNPHRRNPHDFSDYWVYSVGPDSCPNADGSFQFCWSQEFVSSFGRDQYWEYSATNGTKSEGDIQLIQGLGIVN